jgi:hypothetical protein
MCNKLARKSSVPSGRIRVFAMTADLPVAEIKNLHPFGLDHAPGGANKASLVAKHDDRVITSDEFVHRVLLKLKRISDFLEVLLSFFPPTPRPGPWNLMRQRRKNLEIIGAQAQNPRQITFTHSFANPPDRLQVAQFAHDLISHYNSFATLLG